MGSAGASEGLGSKGLGFAGASNGLRGKDLGSAGASNDSGGKDLGSADAATGASPAFDREAFLAGKQTPVFFGSGVNNFGVMEVLDALVDLAPSPGPRKKIGRAHV